MPRGPQTAFLIAAAGSKYHGMRLGQVDHTDHQRRIGEPPLLDIDLGSRGLRIFPREHPCDQAKAVYQASRLAAGPTARDYDF
jgi:hypothetical protein